MLRIKYDGFDFLFLSVVISFSPITYAEMYKWVDENGDTHYSQSPPSDDYVVETIKPQPKVDTDNAKKELEQRRESLLKISEEREKSEQEKLNKEKEEAVKIENCRKAQAKLANNQNAARIRAVDNEGNVVRASEEERQRRIKDAQEKVDKWCN